MNIAILIAASLIGIGNNVSINEKVENELISVSLKNTEVYEYKTGINGDEEGASIFHQAEHFEISEIVRNEETMWEPVYKYKPKPGFIGNDWVELKLSTGSGPVIPGSDGEGSNENIEIIRIEFTIN